MVRVHICPAVVSSPARSHSPIDTVFPVRVRVANAVIKRLISENIEIQEITGFLGQAVDIRRKDYDSFT